LLDTLKLPPFEFEWVEVVVSNVARLSNFLNLPRSFLLIVGADDDGTDGGVVAGDAAGTVAGFVVGVVVVAAEDADSSTMVSLLAVDMGSSGGLEFVSCRRNPAAAAPKASVEAACAPAAVARDDGIF